MVGVSVPSMAGYTVREVCAGFYEVKKPLGRTYGVDLRFTARCSCPWFSCRRNNTGSCKHIRLVEHMLGRRDRVRRRRAVRVAAWFAPPKPFPTRARAVEYVVGAVHYSPMVDPRTDGRERTPEAQAGAERVYRGLTRDFPL